MSLIFNGPFANKSIFDDLFSDSALAYPRSEGAAAALRMHMDVHDSDKELALHFELPGVPKENIEILMEGNTLTVKANKQENKDISEEGYVRRERSFGTVQRKLTLPQNLDKDAVATGFEHGVLSLKFPKMAPTSHVKKIAIN